MQCASFASNNFYNNSMAVMHRSINFSVSGLSNSAYTCRTFDQGLFQLEKSVTQACAGTHLWNTSVKANIFLLYVLEFVSPTGDLVSELIDVITEV